MTSLPKPMEIGIAVPDWLDNQREMLEKTLESEKKIIYVTAPTGNGKSVYAAGLHRLTDSSMTILTRTKQLQKQYESDFGFGQSVIGMGNFNCIIDSKGTSVANAPCRYGFSCPVMMKCGYYAQKEAGNQSPLAISNYDYGLSKGHIDSPIIVGRSYLVCDEADHLDEKITEASSLELTSAQLEVLDDPNPYNKLGNNVFEWSKWAQEKRAEIEGTWMTIQSSMNRQVLKIADVKQTMALGELPTEYRSLVNDYKFYQQLTDTLDAIADLYGEWVISPMSNGVVFRPLWIFHQARELFAKVGQIIMMSATLPNHNIMAKLLGMSAEEFERIDVPSRFPVENRKIITRNVAAMSRETWREGLQKQMVFINQILNKYPSQKVLIHTISNEMRDELVKQIDLSQINRVRTHDTYNRETVITNFQKTKEPLIVVSSSMEAGVDVKDLAINIIPRILWPSLADPWVAKRASEWREWYISSAISKTVQAIGRTPRADGVKGQTLILDSNWKNMIQRRYAYLIPKYIREASL